MDLATKLKQKRPRRYLNHWAIGVIDGGPNGGESYLVFSSHDELLIEVAKRIAANKKDGLSAQDDVKEVFEGLKHLGAKSIALDRLVRPKYSIRSRWELLRKGELKDSDSILGNLIERIGEEEGEGGEADPLDASKLPPLAKIEKYLRNGGSFWEKTGDGWSLTAFILK